MRMFLDLISFSLRTSFLASSVFFNCSSRYSCFWISSFLTLVSSFSVYIFNISYLFFSSLNFFLNSSALSFQLNSTSFKTTFSLTSFFLGLTFSIASAMFFASFLTIISFTLSLYCFKPIASKFLSIVLNWEAYNLKAKRVAAKASLSCLSFIEMLTILSFSSTVKSWSGWNILALKEDAIFFILLGTFCLSVAIIKGLPKTVICLIMLEVEKCFLLFKYNRFFLRSWIDKPVVVPMSKPTNRGFGIKIIISLKWNIYL